MKLKTIETGNAQFTDNGLTLSIGINPMMHYRSGRDFNAPHTAPEYASDDAEMALWLGDNGDLLSFGGDTVAGFVSLSLLPALLSILTDTASASNRADRMIATINAGREMKSIAWAVICRDGSVHEGSENKNEFLFLEDDQARDVGVALDQLDPEFYDCGPHRVAALREVEE